MQRRFIFAPLAAAVVIAACGSGSTTPTATPRSTATPPPSPEIVIAKGAPITIGLSVALSGDQKSIGEDIADAAEISISEHGGAIQGHPVVTSRKDDGCANPRMAVGVARELVADKSVAGVIGPMCTTGAQAADAVYESAHVVHISPSTTRDELSQQGERFFFRTSWRDDQQADAQALYAYNTLAATTAFLIDDGRPYGKGLSKTFAAEFTSLSGHVVTQRIVPGKTDFTKLAAEVTGANPAIVVFEGVNPEAALLLKELRAENYPGSFMAPDAVFNAHDFIDAAGPAADGAIVTAGPLPDLPFIAKFHDRFQRNPGTAFVLESYDAVSLLMHAIDQTATSDTSGALHINREDLAQALRGSKALGLTGVLAFDDHGDRAGAQPAEVGIVVYRVAGGQFQRAS